MSDLRLDSLRPLASLNRRRFLVPSALHSDLAGKTAYDVLSTRALVAAIAARATDLGLPAGDAGAASPQALDAALHSLDGAVRAAAESIAAGYGRRLGYLLASMTGANPISDDPWEQHYLRHWEHEVDTVVLGGGLASGTLGQVIARSVQASAQQLGRSVTVEAAQHPPLLPLIGAARCPTPGQSFTAMSASASSGEDDGAGAALAVLDFGGSGVKSGVALLDGVGTLQALRIRPVIYPEGGTFTDDTRIEQLPGVMVEAMAAVYQAACQIAQRRRPMSSILCSIASYVADGQPVPQLRGGYAQLHRAAGTSDVAGWLAHQVSNAAGAPLTVSFVHDGTASAASLASLERPWSTAVVMLGTALGIGFVPAASGHRSLAQRFTVSPL